MVEFRKPKVVVTIHGIQTTGKWQKEITPHLARHGLIPYHIDFGWFDFLSFLLPWARNRQVQRIRGELRELVFHADVRRISIIAHSFGTYIAMKVLELENGTLSYDRVVLTGSIVRRDFDWQAAFDRKWVLAARNDRATSDFVVSLAEFASRRLRWMTRLDAGSSGRVQFDQTAPNLIDSCIAGSHSETHNVSKYVRWARFIAYPNLPPDILAKVTTEMQALRDSAGKMLAVDPDLVRVNLFAPMGGALRMVPGAVDNMKYAPEFDLRFEVGHGGTGSAFATGNPCIVVRTGSSWSGNNVPTDELAKMNPSVNWVISLPIVSPQRGTVVGVVNVDGLDTTPDMLHDVNDEGCHAAIVLLWLTMAERLAPCLDVAFCGDSLEQVES
jgi:pimeloyl-ACP methyl ester carboxylesterase